MTNDEIRRKLYAIFDAHGDAFRQLRAANAHVAAASNSFDHMLDHLKAANQSFTAMVQAHDEAIQAAITANQAALDLLTQLDSGGA